MPSCVLKCLHSENLNGPLIGLDIRDGSLAVDTSIFPCCAGKGIAEEAPGVMRQCDLHRRMLMVHRLLNQYYLLWGQQFPLIPKDINRAPALFNLSEVKNMTVQGAPTGKILRSPAANQPSRLWPVALTLAWRFGVVPHFVCFGKSPKTKYLPDARRDGDGVTAKAIFVGRIDNLSDPINAFEFETIVSYAYHAQSLLFIEFIAHDEAKARGPFRQGASQDSGKGYFSRKISQLRKQPVAKFLQPDCLSRLENMCGSLKLIEVS